MTIDALYNEIETYLKSNMFVRNKDVEKKLGIIGSVFDCETFDAHFMEFCVFRLNVSNMSYFESYKERMCLSMEYIRKCHSPIDSIVLLSCGVFYDIDGFKSFLINNTYSPLFDVRHEPV